MTSPQYATRGPGGRWYQLPSPPLPEELHAPSVTTILSKGMPAPALKMWGERIVAEYAIDNLEAWQSLDRDAALDLVKRAPYRNMTSAGDTGTDVHAMCETIMRGGHLGEYEQLYPEHLGHFRRWLDQWGVEPIMVERTVFRRGNRPYAGSFDFIARIDGQTVLGDIKTSKGVYAKTGLQLAAYASAEGVLSDDGRRLEQLPHIDALGILHLREDRADWYPIDDTTENLYAAFEAVYDVAQFEIQGHKEVMGRKPADPGARHQYRDELRARVAQVIEWGGADELAAAWPADVPTLKHDGHTTHQLDAIDYLLRRIEPSWRPKPPVGSIDRHAETIGRLDEITDQQMFDTIQKYAVSVGIPNLHTATATVDQLDQLDRIITAVVKVPDPEDRAARIGRATSGRTTSPADITADELARYLRTRKSKSINQQKEAAA